MVEGERLKSIRKEKAEARKQGKESTRDEYLRTKHHNMVKNHRCGVRERREAGKDTKHEEYLRETRANKIYFKRQDKKLEEAKKVEEAAEFEKQRLRKIKHENEIKAFKEAKK